MFQDLQPTDYQPVLPSDLGYGIGLVGSIYAGRVG